MESRKCAQPLFYLPGMMLILVCRPVSNRHFGSRRIRKTRPRLPAPSLELSGLILTSPHNACCRPYLLSRRRGAELRLMDITGCIVVFQQQSQKVRESACSSWEPRFEVGNGCSIAEAITGGYKQ